MDLFITASNVHLLSAFRDVGTWLCLNFKVSSYILQVQSLVKNIVTS